jgi:hypothetical protein
VNVEKKWAELGVSGSTTRSRSKKRDHRHSSPPGINNPEDIEVCY